MSTITVPPNVRYRMQVRVTETTPGRRGVWICGDVNGDVWRQGLGFVADSAHFLINEQAPVYHSMQEAATVAHRREIIHAPGLEELRRAFPGGQAVVLMMDANDPVRSTASTDTTARPTNLSSWQRKAVQTARIHRNLMLAVKDLARSETWLFAVVGKHVEITVRRKNEPDRSWVSMNGMMWPVAAQEAKIATG